MDILSYIDQVSLYNDFNRCRSYLDQRRPGDDPQRPSNRLITSTDLETLRCPDDATYSPTQGNLSYVVNGGFSRWHAEGHAYGWADTPTGGATGPKLDWGEKAATQSGVMFLGTLQGNTPWDHKSSLNRIPDGTSTTVLIAEYHLAGASNGTAYSDWVPTNWACPHPNFCMFVGSDDVCTKGGVSSNCSTAGDLGEKFIGGTGWSRANRPGSPESINSGRGRTVEGSSPFPNSKHPGIIIVGMCDGSVRSVSEKIDGAVWAKLLTPDGGQLPARYRQGSINPGDY